MSYKIEVKPMALKSLRKLDKNSRRLVVSFLDDLELSKNPKTYGDVKKLKGLENGYRWRIGVYRILGTIEDDIITITIFKIGHRRDVYRGV